VKLLLKFRGIDINPRDSQMKMTPLQIAAERGFPDILQVLLSYDGPAKAAELNARDKREATALIIVAEVGNGSCAKLLLKRPGIELNAQDSEGKTALHAAAERGGGEVLTMLIETPGINVNLKDRGGETAMHYGVKGIDNKPDIDVVKALLKAKGIDLTVINVFFWGQKEKVCFWGIRHRLISHRKRGSRRLWSY
jgi:ankyrin repeat protein